MPTIKQIPRVISQDHTLNKVQDQLAAALNPILRAVKGDLSGPLESPKVIKLQGYQVDPAEPTTGDVLTYDGAKWTHSAVDIAPITAPIGKLIYQTAPIQNISNGTTAFQPTTTYHRFTVSGGNQNIAAIPTIVWPGAVVGQVVILHNVTATGGSWVQINRGADTALSLSNSNARIDPGGTMFLIYNGALWIEITHTQATRT